MYRTTVYLSYIIYICQRIFRVCKMLIYLYIKCNTAVMKKFIKNLIQYMLCAYFVLTILNGITIPTNTVYLISSLLILAIAVFLSSAILGFLTIRENFITSFIMVSLLSIGAFFLLQQFMPGFSIEVYDFNGINTGNLVIHPFTITAIINMVFGGLIHSLLCSVLKVLEKSS